MPKSDDTEEVPRCAWQEGFRHPDQGYEIWNDCLNPGDHEMEDGNWLCEGHADDHYQSEEADLLVKRVKERRDGNDLPDFVVRA